jgi:thioesterase superfamily protein 4
VVLFDEVMGQVSYCHRDLDKIGLTTSMSVEFKRPVKTPGLVVFRAWLDDKSEGRNMSIRGTVEDIHGKVYATGEGVFREVSHKKFSERDRSNL